MCVGGQLVIARIVLVTRLGFLSGSRCELLGICMSRVLSFCESFSVDAIGIVW